MRGLPPKAGLERNPIRAHSVFLGLFAVGPRQPWPWHRLFLPGLPVSGRRQAPATRSASQTSIGFRCHPRRIMAPTPLRASFANSWRHSGWCGAHR